MRLKAFSLCSFVYEHHINRREKWYEAICGRKLIQTYLPDKCDGLLPFSLWTTLFFLWEYKFDSSHIWTYFQFINLCGTRGRYIAAFTNYVDNIFTYVPLSTLVKELVYRYKKNSLTFSLPPPYLSCQRSLWTILERFCSGNLIVPKLSKLPIMLISCLFDTVW